MKLRQHSSNKQSASGILSRFSRVLALAVSGQLLLAPAATAGSATADCPPAVKAAASKGSITEPLLNDLGQAVKDNPDSANLHMTLAEAFYNKGFEQLAREQFALAKRQDAQFVLKHFHARLSGAERLNPLPLFWACRNEFADDPGVVYYGAWREQILGHQENALTQMRKAAALPDAWPGAEGMLAEMEAGLNLWPDAEKHAAEQLKSNPDNVQALSVYVRSQSRAGRPPAQMLSEIKKAVAGDPGDPYMSFLLARALLAQGDYRQALAPALRCLVVPYGMSDQIQQALAIEICRHVPRDFFLKSVDALATPLASSPYNPLLRLRIASVLLEGGEKKDAHRQLQAALLSGDALLNPSLALKLGDMAESEFADDRLALRFYAQASRPGKNSLGHRSEEALLSRIYNRNNDLAWQLRDALWKKSDAPPAVALPARPPRQAPETPASTHR